MNSEISVESIFEIVTNVLGLSINLLLLWQSHRMLSLAVSLMLIKAFKRVY